MTFNDFYKGMDQDELKAYADRCGTTVLYLKHQLRRANKVPRADLLNALWEQSRGKLTRQDVLDHFYPSAERQTA